MNINPSDIDAALKSIQATQDEQSLESIRLQWLGKQGTITKAFKGLGAIDPKEKAATAQQLNQAKDQLNAAINAQKKYFANKILEEKLAQKIDVTLPPFAEASGQVHPIHQVIQKLNVFFAHRGFESKSDFNFEIEDETHNFDLLNIPSYHPARSMQDTFYCGEHILRTHVSAAQPRILKSSKLPLSVVVFGRVFRCDPLDATHSPVFHQMECLHIDRKCNFGHLKHIIEEFILHLFGERLPVRYRSSYFPFTEPSVEIDVWMPSKNAWLEILGAGMVHPNVIREAGHDPSEYRGFAFGVGIERLAMLYFGLDDIRDLYGSDLQLLGDCYLWH